MNWLKISWMMLIGHSIAFGQVPRDTSYTVKSTVSKICKQYPNLDIKGVLPRSPKTVNTTFGIVYKSIEDREVLANLFSPVENNNRTGILLIHGGGWRTGHPGLMTPMAERFAANGYTVIAPEYRMSLEAPYPAAVEDMKDALQWMKDHAKELKIDQENMVVMGCSAGGQLAALIGTTESVLAIVDVDGVLAFKHPDSSEGEMAAQWLGGSYDEVPEIWKEASALSHVSKKTPPTLFLASKHPRFLAGHKEFMAVLKEAGTYTEIQYLENAPHSFWLVEPWFEPTINYTLKFLNKTININN